MKSVLLSVRPVYANAILAGTKTSEVRRRFPEQPEGAEVYLYASSPQRAVLGAVRLDSIERPEPSRVWELYQSTIEIDEEPLTDYLAASSSAAVLKLSSPETWQRPVSLRQLREQVDLEPAQSFRYLTEAQARLLRELGTGLKSRRQSSPSGAFSFA